MSEWHIRIKGGIDIAVPPTLSRITTWVLLEQEDWFEKEIGFLRAWLKPGMRVIDIGANHGVYALTMAKRVAPDGAVWAFEPTREPAALLRQSAERNGLANLRLLEMALSDQDGQAMLHRNVQSELNSLILSYESEALDAESVAVSSLDCQQAALQWGAIDFVKIDAEGAGLKILSGGARFFAEQSPLVMFEAGDTENDRQTLPAAFRARGYDIYRLVGPDVFLAPVGAEEQLTGFDLNLFACKPDRAAQLAAAGLLIRAAEALTSIPSGGGRALFDRQAYAASFPSVMPRSPIYARTLDAYALWRDEQAALAKRYTALCTALAAAQQAVREKASLARILTLVRIAFEAGARQFAIDLLPRAMPLLGADAALPDEPFFPPMPRYDMIAPGAMARAWLLAATFEAFEIWQFFSGCFKPLGMQEHGLLDWIQSSPFASAPMERRRQLQRCLAGLQPSVQTTPLLAQASPENLNPELWARALAG